MAAKVKQSLQNVFREKPKVKRPGVHAKTKTSRVKTSKFYTKAYKGQGK